MSGSELLLLAQSRGGVDWPWLERWLSDGLGVPVRAVVRADARARTPAANTPMILYGDAEFCRDGRQAGDGAAVVEAASDDLFISACRLLRTVARERGICASEATLDRRLASLGRALDARYATLARRPRWPAPYRWALVLTHDVDAVDRWTAAHVRHLARHMPARYRHEGPRAIVRLPWAAIRGLWDRPPIARRLRACLDVERRHGIRATYLFFAPNSRYREALDGWYTPMTVLGPNRTVAEFWEELAASGFDVGLHLSIGAHARPEAIKAEWMSMRAHAPDLATYRSHHLADAPGITLPTLTSLGARVDLNLVADGFAWGSGLPWRMHGASDEIFRLPTVIEDSPLEVDGGSAKAQDAFWRRCQPILEEAERTESAATVLLHPENPGSVELLGRLIGWARDRGAWLTSAADLVDYWRERSAALVPSSKSDVARR